MRADNLMIVQGGGPTTVFNASLSGIIAEGLGRTRIGRILGAKSGTEGLTQGNVIDLSQMTSDELRVLRNSPGAALGSSRFKPTEEHLKLLVEHLQRLKIKHLIFMGGNGTMRGAETIGAYCRSIDFEVQIIGVPKTIDNDLAATDRCPGYASAARYIAQSTRDLGMDIRSLPQPITILETMGRSVGWLAGAASLARVAENDAPHLIYVPELPFHTEKFLKDLDRIVTRLGWAVVVVSEGIRHEDGNLVYELNDPSQLDPLKRPMTGGVGQFLAGVVAKNLKIRCRSEKPGLLGRASMAHVSVQDQLDAELVGRAGVGALLSGETDKMVALRPLKDPGPLGYDLVPLNTVAGIERAIPEEWLAERPLTVTDGFVEYLRPLVGELFQYSPALLSGLLPMGVS